MKTKQEFDKELFNRWNGRIKEHGYTRTHHPCIFIDTKCGYKWKEALAENLIEKGRKHPCPHCWNQSRHLTDNNFQKRLIRVNKKNHTAFKSLTKCKGSHEKIKMIDTKNNHEWWTTPHRILRGASYQKVGVNLPPTTIQFQKKLDKIYGKNHFTVLSSYGSLNARIYIRCNKHHYTWWANPHNLLRGHGCPKNKTSHGETIMSNLMKQMHIKFYYAKRFHNPILHGHQDFDFYLPEYKPYRQGKTWKGGLAFEIDGVQHRKPVAHFGGYKKLYETQMRDKAKNIYCLTHHIWLVRIPFYDRSNYKRYLIRCYRVLKSPGLLRK